MTDIHAHILPGLDDGPETVEESIDMIYTAYENGTDRIDPFFPSVGSCRLDTTLSKSTRFISARSCATIALSPSMAGTTARNSFVALAS